MDYLRAAETMTGTPINVPWPGLSFPQRGQQMQRPMMCGLLLFAMTHRIRVKNPTASTEIE